MAITPLPTPPSRSAPATFSTLADAFLGSLPTFVTECNATAAAMDLNDTTDTSSSSVAIGTGAKTFTVTAGKSFQPGMYLVIADAAAPSTNSMLGQVTSYSSTTLVMNIISVLGSGTKTSWVISMTGPTGAAGADGAAGSNAWTQTTGTFTATPASTSTLTMTSDLTSSIKAGMSLKYTIGGTVYYGMVSAITTNLLTVAGAPLSGDVTALYYGGGTVRQMAIIIPGYYEDASNTALIASDLKSSFIWCLPTSYLVFYKVYSNTHDTGTHGQASVRINSTEVNTAAGGLTIAADATWYSTVVDIAVAAYDINPGEALEVTAVKGGNGNASDLTVHMIFVTP